MEQTPTVASSKDDKRLLVPIKWGFIVGSILSLLILVQIFANRLPSGEFQRAPKPLIPLSAWWVSAILFCAYMVILGFLPDRISDKIPDYVVAALSFNLGIWLAFTLFFFTSLAAVGINKLFYKLPGKYFNYVALSVLPAGYIIHRFKRFNQTYYGTVEVLFGIATGMGTTLGIKVFGAAQGIAIMGAVYVVARGFNNIYEARKPKNTGP